jgi:hypothetical protein
VRWTNTTLHAAFSSFHAAAAAAAAAAEADEDASAEAAAKDFDSWGDAPGCSYPKTDKNFKSDRLGRAWGYNSATGESCAFKVAAGERQLCVTCCDVVVLRHD